MIKLTFLKEPNKASSSKERHISHYWYFLDKGFTFQSHVFNNCLDGLTLFVNLNDIVEK